MTQDSQRAGRPWSNWGQSELDGMWWRPLGPGESWRPGLGLHLMVHKLELLELDLGGWCQGPRVPEVGTGGPHYAHVWPRGPLYLRFFSFISSLFSSFPSSPSLMQKTTGDELQTAQRSIFQEATRRFVFRRTTRSRARVTDVYKKLDKSEQDKQKIYPTFYC